MGKYEDALKEIMVQRGFSGMTVDTVITITELNPRARQDIPKILKITTSERQVIKAVQPYIRERQNQACS